MIPYKMNIFLTLEAKASIFQLFHWRYAAYIAYRRVVLAYINITCSMIFSAQRF